MRPTPFLKTCILAIVASLPCMAWPQISADVYPAKPVTVVVPFTPGGSTDIETRLYAQKLSDNTGQPFLVDLKPGAGTTTGTNYVARATPDGYTLLSYTSSFTSAPALFVNITYDPVKDFAPISLMSKRTIVMVMTPSVPIRTISEYIAFTKARPGEINVATPGAGSGPHLNGVWLQDLINTKVTFVHYKGAGQSLIDLLAGRVHMISTLMTTAFPYIKTGKLQAIAVANAERSLLMPNLLTVAEQGVSGYDYPASPFGIVAPAATPATVVNKLHRELVRVAKAPDIVMKIEADGGQTVANTPDQFRKIIVSEIARYRKLAQDHGIKLEE